MLSRLLKCILFFFSLLKIKETLNEFYLNVRLFLIFKTNVLFSMTLGCGLYTFEKENVFFLKLIPSTLRSDDLCLEENRKRNAQNKLHREKEGEEVKLVWVYAIGGGSNSRANPTHACATKRFDDEPSRFILNECFLCGWAQKVICWIKN